MQSQHHINATGSVWYRCSRVVFEGEIASWELSSTSKYDLLKAYEKRPHRRLVEATDDDSLKNFVKAWGPLRLSLNTWKGKDPISTYRGERDFLRASVQLLTAIQERKNLHEAAIRLLKLNPDPSGIWVRNRLGIPGDLEDALDDKALNRISSSTREEILDICNFLVGLFPIPKPSFFIERRGMPTLRPTLGTYSLTDALHWMVWQDVLMESPFQFCKECHSLIDQTSKHRRKFCGGPCAQRVAARKWRKNDLKNKRKQKRMESIRSIETAGVKRRENNAKRED